MILQSINDYVHHARRIEEKQLLKHFHLSREALAPMMEVLLKRGNIQKTVNRRGASLAAEIYYSWHDTKQIPALTLV